MDPRSKLMAYVESVGGPTKAAEVLRTPLPTMYAVCNGWKGVGRRLASRWEVATNGALKAAELVWVLPTRKERKA